MRRAKAREMIALSPKRGEGYVNLANTRKFKDGEREIEAIESS